MSVVPFIIELIKRKKNRMTENNPYGEDQTTPAESTHPVLKQLNDKITELQTQLDTNKATASTLDAEHLDTIRKLRVEKWAFEERVKNVLVDSLEDYDEDTIKHIAEELDITLNKTKQIEVNITFTIDVEYEIGEEPDPEWDFDFSVSHSDIVDYSSDIVYTKDIS
jgi:ABC-type enterochelin transport system substrate-binding protein